MRVVADEAVFLITVHAASPGIEKKWADSLRAALRELVHIRVDERSRASMDGKMIFIDSAHPQLDTVLAAIDRQGRSVFLLYQDGEPLPRAFSDGKVDDLLIFPLRPLDLLSRLRYHEQLQLWQQVTRMNASLSQVMQGLKQDIGVAERLQKERLPLRFPDIKGFKVTSRYLAGMKSGGDYMDLAESADGQQMAVIMTDSSSYGLSSAVVSGVVRVASRLSVEQSRSVREMVRAFYEELTLPLGPSDRLSLFYGVLSRKDYVLRFLNLGEIRAFRRSIGGKFEALAVSGGPLSQGSRYSLSGGAALQESSLALQPQDRLVIVSDGYLELLGGIEPTRELLDRFSEKPPEDLLNELVFTAKSKLADPREDLPEQDCTAMIFDVDARVMRLV